LTVTLHAPRLLPLTMLVGAMLLATKIIVLLHAALPGSSPLTVSGDVLSSARAAPASGPDPNATPSSGASGSDTHGAPQPTSAPAALVQSAPAQSAPAQSGAAQPAATSHAGEVPRGLIHEPPRPPPPPPAAIAPITTPPMPDITEGERSVLLDLRKRRAELDAREQRDTERETMLAAAEKRLADRVRELQALQTRLEALEAQRASREDANWRGLVKMYEAMRPRDAATIFNDLDMTVLLPVLDRMSERKAAAVLAAMQPDKARLATTQLAALREKEITPADPKPIDPNPAGDAQPAHSQSGDRSGGSATPPGSSGS
jgi:flagellar motility protein MotE (MotC chaperone)